MTTEHEGLVARLFEEADCTNDPDRAALIREAATAIRTLVEVLEEAEQFIAKEEALAARAYVSSRRLEAFIEVKKVCRNALASVKQPGGKV